jgi:UDP-glucose 4-epimerase
MKKVLVTGGAGFVGSNLIKSLLWRKEYADIQIVSLDNYFTGKVENHIDDPRVRYVFGATWEVEDLFRDETFDTVFHFGEYSRIVKSFDDVEYVSETILFGTPKVLQMCRKWGAKLIYSASSSKFGNEGRDENLSPYSWMKAKMVELVKNYAEWYGLKYEICYFFNVYGPGQITEGDYATVVGIFERQFRAGQPLTVVIPGSQSRDFTHIYDVIDGVVAAAISNLQGEWHLRSGVNVPIKEVAEMFGTEWTLIPERKGERFTSHEFESDTEARLNWKPTHSLKQWIDQIVESTPDRKQFKPA